MDSLDCKRFQHAAGADLSELDPVLLAHAENCDDCSAFLEEARCFDELLRGAIKIDVPDDLIQKTLRHKDEVQPESSGGTSRFPRFMAIAASVLLIVGASFMANRIVQPPEQSLEQIVISHIEAEPEMLTLANYVPDDSASARLLDYGVLLRESMGKLSHVELCDVGDTQGIHIVMKGEKGPVTLLLLPTIKSQAASHFSEGRWIGYSEPVGSGTVAIVGVVGEPLDEVKKRVRKAIEWL